MYLCKQKSMRNIKDIQLFTFIICFLILGSCTNTSSHLNKLNQIDSLMECNPKASYDSLCHYKKLMLKSNRKEEMKYRLLVAKAENILFIDMSSDSLFQEVVDYYEKKGTSKEKMMAHYLQGCIYRDQKEAPMALQSYKKAVEYADTLNKDCDYSMLYRIYGQISEIFIKQKIYSEAIEAMKKYSFYAKKAHHVKDYLLGLERLIPFYYSKGDTALALAQTNMCAKLYKKHNMFQEAAGVYPTLISIYINRGQFNNAYRYMKIFEEKSGLFYQGGICPHREYYYVLKGRYFLGVHQLDSAEYYFRKLKAFNYHRDADKGLLTLYSIRHLTDSIVKYASLYETDTDEALQKNQASAVLQISALYNYNGIEKKANENFLKAVRSEKNCYILSLMLLASFLLLVIISIIYKQKMKSKKQAIETWNDNYMKLVNDLELNKKELQEAKMSQSLMIESKRQTIRALEEEIQSYKTSFSAKLSNERNVILDDNNTFKLFKSSTLPKKNMMCPSEKNWNELEQLVEKNYPIFFKKLSNTKTSTLEFRVCLLTRLRFSNSEIAILLETSPSSISNAKQKANEKIFGQKGASSLLKNMLNLKSEQR